MSRKRILSLLLLPVAALLAQAQVYSTLGDTYISQANPTNNFGNIGTMTVGPLGSPGLGNVALVQVDISRLVALGVSPAQIQQATFTVYVHTVGVAGGLDLATLMTPWSESTATYNAAPTPSGAVQSNVPVSGSNGYVTFDITSVLQGWLGSPATNNGLQITAALAQPNTQIILDTKESTTTSHPAFIDVVLTATGAAGPTGPMGAVGATGAAGPSGSAGPTGAAGPSGSAGPTGAAGPSGSAGPTGAAGPSGSAGPTGAAGPSGSVGATGAAGPSGSVGATGAAGPSGSAGPTGAAGPSGSAGPTGAAGPSGSVGATGAAGPSGAVGATGAAGPSGSAGTVGATGPMGAVGAKGANGSQGAAGPSGPTGPTGTVTPGGVATAIMTSFGSVSLGTGGTAFAAGLSGGLALSNSSAFAETFKEEPIPAACTLNNLFVRISVGTANAYQIGVVLYRNGSPTTLTCSTGMTSATAGATSSCSDTTHTVTVSAGDTLAYLVTPNASNNNNNIAISMHCQ